MASDEADDDKRRTSPHSSSGSQQQRRLFTILFVLSITVTISLLFFFYHIRIKIKPSGKLDAEQKDDERGHGFEIWEILLTLCVPLFTWRFRWQLSRMLQRCFVVMQQHQQRRKSSMIIIIIMATLLCLTIMRQILYRPSLCNIRRGDSWMTTDVGYIRTHPHTSSLGVSMRTLCDGRVWEPWVARAIEQHLYGQGRAIDVGAFIGYHTIRLAKAAAPHKVYAFEGRPSSDLTENIKRNNAKNVHLVTDTIDENWTLSPQLERELLNSNDEDDGKEDNIEGPPVSLIKIDCEGCELHFLRGAKKVLQKYHPVLIIEIQDDESRKNAKVGGQRMIQPNKESRQDVLDYLSNELGYIVEALRDDDGVETWDYLAYSL